jgi:MATE family multidrug resistance protein
MIERALSRIRLRWSSDGGYRQVLELAVPLVFSTASWSIQTFVNRMFLAWHSADSVAASMPASMLNFAILSAFINTAGYVSTFAAQHHGAGQDERVGRVMWQALWIAVIGGLLNALFIPGAPSFFRLVGHHPAVQAEEVAFFRILCLGAFPIIMATAFSGMLSGLGRTRVVMWVTLAGTGANILFDYLFIFGNWGFPALGISGAGWSTVTASLIQFGLFLFIVTGRPYRGPYRTLDWRPDRKAFWRLIRFGLPSGIQFGIDMAAFTAFIMLVGRLGRNELAATNIAFNINTIAFMPMIGLGMTVSILVGQALGRNDPHRARYSVRSAFDLTFLFMGTIAVLFGLFPGLFLLPFEARSDPATFAEVARIAMVLLRFVAVYTLFDALNIIFSSAIKGAGDTRFVMYMVIALLFGILIIPTTVAVIWLGASVYVCWTIASTYVAALGISFYARYRGGKWEKIRVIEHPIPAVVHRPESPPVEC